MKIALLADLHGNRVALEAVLLHARAQHVERVICLGDVTLFGPQPAETLDYLIELEIPVVMGNADRWLLDPQLRQGPDLELELINAVESWCAQQLTPAHMAIVAAWPPTITLDLPGGLRLVACHASPRDDSEQVLVTSPGEELDDMLAGVVADVVAGGHTHTQMLRKHRGSILINPGSVGQVKIESLAPGEKYAPWAEYAILEAKPGSLSVSFHMVGFNLDALLNAARRSGMPHATWWIERWR
jgi:predicted phosphodiesterase